MSIRRAGHTPSARARSAAGDAGRAVVGGTELQPPWRPRSRSIRRQVTMRRPSETAQSPVSEFHSAAAEMNPTQGPGDGRAHLACVSLCPGRPGLSLPAVQCLIMAVGHALPGSRVVDGWRVIFSLLTPMWL